MLTSSEGQGIGDCLYQARGQWLTPERWREGGEKGGSEGEREKGERERREREREKGEREREGRERMTTILETLRF